MKREAGGISLSYAYTSSPSQKRILKGMNSTESWIPFPVNQERGWENYVISYAQLSWENLDMSDPFVKKSGVSIAKF